MVIIKLPTGTRTTIECNDDETGSSLQLKLLSLLPSLKLTMHPASMELVVSGRVINNDSLLSDYGIADESTLDLTKKSSVIESFNPLPLNIITLDVRGTIIKTSRTLLTCDKIAGSLLHSSFTSASNLSADSNGWFISISPPRTLPLNRGLC